MFNDLGLNGSEKYTTEQCVGYSFFANKVNQEIFKEIPKDDITENTKISILNANFICVYDTKSTFGYFYKSIDLNEFEFLFKIKKGAAPLDSAFLYVLDDPTKYYIQEKSFWNRVTYMYDLSTNNLTSVSSQREEMLKKFFNKIEVPGIRVVDYYGDDWYIVGSEEQTGLYFYYYANIKTGEMIQIQESFHHNEFLSGNKHSLKSGDNIWSVYIIYENGEGVKVRNVEVFNTKTKKILYYRIDPRFISKSTYEEIAGIGNNENEILVLEWEYGIPSGRIRLYKYYIEENSIYSTTIESDYSSGLFFSTDAEKLMYYRIKNDTVNYGYFQTEFLKNQTHQFKMINSQFLAKGR